ncbi:MAG: metallophosphoesterase [Polyangiaceae bacterium]
MSSGLRRECAERATHQVVLVLSACWLIAGCSNEPAKPSVEACSGAFSVELRSFLDGPTTTGGPQEIPSYLYVSGQVYDGPYPGSFVETALPAPDDATPGCAVYSVAAPNCANIGGCGPLSQDSECAAAAGSANPCVCVDTDTCQRFPKLVSVGNVTVSGVADTLGNTTHRLKNLSNSYQIPDGTKLGYPGFAEGDRIALSATGGTCPAFELESQGVAPLSFTSEAYSLARIPDSNDPTQYGAFQIEWDPPHTALDSRMNFEMDISHHGGTVGFLGCDVEDNGSLTISAGLVSQLIALGGIGGYPELVVERTISEIGGDGRGRGRTGGDVGQGVRNEDRGLYVVPIRRRLQEPRGLQQDHQAVPSALRLGLALVCALGCSEHETRKACAPACHDPSCAGTSNGFFFFGDAHFGPIANNARNEVALRQMSAIDPNAIAAFSNGDLVDGDSESQWATHDAALAKGGFAANDSCARAGYFGALGDHDVSDGHWFDLWNSHFGAQEALGPDTQRGIYYAVTYGDALFVVLDSEHTSSDKTSYADEQTHWLESVLAASNAPLKFVFFHEPVYPCSGHHAPFAAGLPWVDLGERYGVSAFIGSHTHLYSRSCPRLAGACARDGSGIGFFRDRPDWRCRTRPRRDQRDCDGNRCCWRNARRRLRLRGRKRIVSCAWLSE